MKSIIKLQVVAILIAIVFFSCSDDYLDLKDKQNITESSFWSTKDHAIQGITATYAALQWI